MFHIFFKPKRKIVTNIYLFCSTSNSNNSQCSYILYFRIIFASYFLFFYYSLEYEKLLIVSITVINSNTYLLGWVRRRVFKY